MQPVAQLSPITLARKDKMTFVSLNKLVQKFDRNLFAKVSFDGTLRVYCKSFKLKRYDLDGFDLLVSVEEPYHVFSLTDTWGYNGKKRDWGMVFVEQKLAQIRLDNRDKQIREIEESERKAKESKDRATANMTESMAHEMHSVIKHEMKDVLFHNTTQKDSRYLNDKKLKGI